MQHNSLLLIQLHLFYNTNDLTIDTCSLGTSCIIIDWRTNRMAFGPNVAAGVLPYIPRRILIAWQIADNSFGFRAPRTARQNSAHNWVTVIPPDGSGDDRAPVSRLPRASHSAISRVYRSRLSSDP